MFQGHVELLATACSSLLLVLSHVVRGGIKWAYSDKLLPLSPARSLSPHRTLNRTRELNSVHHQTSRPHRQKRAISGHVFIPDEKLHSTY